MPQRKGICRVCIACITCGAETLTLTNQSAMKLKTTQRTMEPLILGVLLRDRVQNDYIQKKYVRFSDSLVRERFSNWRTNSESGGASLG